MDRSLQIRRRLRLRDFEMLLAVERAGSMAGAARQLSVSQAAISKAVAEMEHTLRLQLFDRTARGVLPTLYGHALLKGAVAVIDDIRQSVREIEHLADPTTGEVRIGATEPIVAGMLPVLLDQLCRRHPRLTVHVTESSTVAAQYRDLREREVDLLIGRLLADIREEELNAEALFDDPLLVVAGENSPWARRRRIHLRDLVNEPWTLPKRDTIVRRLLDDVFRGEGLKSPDTGIVSNSIQLANLLLATGRYLAVFPRSLVRLSGERLRIRPLPVHLPARPWPVQIITLKNRSISPAAELFIERARSIAKRLVD
jgi:DNA-binding transcriptional LysR family regulator